MTVSAGLTFRMSDTGDGHRFSHSEMAPRVGPVADHGSVLSMNAKLVLPQSVSSTLSLLRPQGRRRDGAAPEIFDRGHRPEVQGLRALAVTLVLVYHLWPARFTGGFIGVDTFFVISGFLISSHMYRESPGAHHKQRWIGAGPGLGPIPST